jgi:hypothetical protein
VRALPGSGECSLRVHRNSKEADSNRSSQVWTAFYMHAVGQFVGFSDQSCGLTTSRFFVQAGMLRIKSLLFSTISRSTRSLRVGVSIEVDDELEVFRALALTALSCSRSSATVDGPLRILSLVGLDLTNSEGAISKSAFTLGRTGGGGVATALMSVKSKGLISCFFSSGCSSVSSSSRNSRRQRLSFGRGVRC